MKSLEYASAEELNAIIERGGVQWISPVNTFDEINKMEHIEKFENDMIRFIVSGSDKEMVLVVRIKDEWKEVPKIEQVSNKCPHCGK